VKRQSRLAGVVVLAVIGVSILVATSEHKGSGARGPAVGSSMPVFAAPLALSTLVGDVNISDSACGVKLKGAFTSCSALKKGQMILGFVTVSDRECAGLADSFQLISMEYPSISPVLVGLQGSRSQLRKFARRAPGVTVVQDRDGALSTRYGIAVCPTVVVAARGGEVLGTLIGSDTTNPVWLLSRVYSLIRADLLKSAPQR